MRLAVINTGGTISCVGAPLSPMTALEFQAACADWIDPVVVEAFPDIELVYLTDLAFPGSASGLLDSTNLQPADWCRIAAYLLEHYEAADGFVVLHGTDTLDFSGTALSLLLSRFDRDGTPLALPSKPVVLTGSQVPLFQAGPDGNVTGLGFNTDAFQNMCAAMAVARSGVPGVSVVFDSLVLRGARAVKTDANQFRGFTSPNAAPLGQVGIALDLGAEGVPPGPFSPDVSLDTPKVRQESRRQLVAITAQIDRAQVMLLPAVPAWSDPDKGRAFLADIIRACVDAGAGGLVLQAYGEGNFPSGHASQPEKGAIFQALAQAHAAGVVIVDNTQVLKAMVDYSAYAAGAWLPAVGAINPADMTPMASLAKLTILLATAEVCGWSRSDVRYLMEVPLVGEMAERSRLDNRTQPLLLPGQTLFAAGGGARLRNDPRLGPVLEDGDGQRLWSMLSRPGDHALPVRLRLGEDGNLRLIDRNGSVTWESSTGQGTLNAVQLRLRSEAGDVSLSLVDLATRQTIWTVRHRASTLGA